MTTPALHRPLQAYAPVLACFGVLCLLASGPTQAGDGKKVLLRYKFEPGQIVRYDVTMNDDYAIQVGAAVDEPYSHQTSTKNYEVMKVNPDGSAILQLTIESVKLKIHQNDQSFEYDSRADDSPEEQPVFQAMENLVGVPHLQLQMTPTGEVSAFVPLVHKDQVPKEKPHQVAFDVLQRLPEDPVAIGDTWHENFEVKLAPIPDAALQPPVNMQWRYTLQKLEGSVATIGLATKILSVVDSPDVEMQLMRRQPKGTIVIDLDRGLLVSKHLTQEKEVSGFGMGASLMKFSQLHRETLRQVQVANSPAQSATK